MTLVSARWQHDHDIRPERPDVADATIIQQRAAFGQRVFSTMTKVNIP